MSKSSQSTSVYRYYDRHGLLIYVGITSRGIKRNLEHASDKEWWPHVASQEVEHYDTRREASEREKSLIREFHPPFNTHHNPDHETLRDAHLQMFSGSDVDILTFDECRQQVGKRLPLDVLLQGGDYLHLSTRPEHYELARIVNWKQGSPRTVRDGMRVGVARKIQLAGRVVVFEVELDDALPRTMEAFANLTYSGNKKPVQVEFRRIRVEVERPLEELVKRALGTITTTQDRSAA